MCVCVGVCVCVTLCVCLVVIMLVARWQHSATWCQVRSILSIRTRNYNTCQDDPFPDPNNQPDHIITFWHITSKHMDCIWTDSHQILPVCSSDRGTPNMLRILRSIHKSIFYCHFKRIRAGPKKSSTSCF